jgi:hypothetical protein
MPANLGSLTRPGATSGATCHSCGSARITELAMTLTDGSPVRFISCHTCENRAWSQAGQHLSFDSVLDKTRKLR